VAGDEKYRKTMQNRQKSNAKKNQKIKKVFFLHNLFNMLNLQCLLMLHVIPSLITGWMRGKTAILVGKDRSLMTLLSKKRGRLYLTRRYR